MSKKKVTCDNLDQLVHEGEVDDAMYEALARCLEDDLKRFARTRCGTSRSDVEDITQDALLAARQYLGSFRGEASLRTWLFRLVISACSRRRRGQKNNPNLHLSLDQVEPSPVYENPEISLMVNERLDALRQAIDKLRPRDREMLSKVEWQGLSLAQVAQQHDLTVPAVKSRMFRIRQQLKELMRETFPEQDP